MTKILLTGCNGKMGQVITRLALDFEGVEIMAGIDINDTMSSCYPVYKNTDVLPEDIKADVIIDFSHPSLFEGLMKYCGRTGTPIILATTGLSQTQKDSMAEYSENVPLFFSANMSLGINLIMDLVKKAAKVLEGNFDIEIIDRHHNQKIDAPSGTALAIADQINSALSEKYDYNFDRSKVREKRNKKEIGFHAVRGGTIVGDHSVIFAGNDEVIEINHSAASKEVFAIGALKAAVYMTGKEAGMYSMKDLIAAIT